MHDGPEALADNPAPIEKPRERLISVPYLMLRGSTAAGAFAMGFVQTFVFARVLSPDRFSIFIVVGAIGYTLWLCDLGLAKILFVKLRAAHLAGKSDKQAAGEATAVILFYGALAVTSSVACFATALTRSSFSMLEAAQLGLFFLYITLNLTWFSLRSISIAVDLYVFYERLEVTRRVVNMASMLTVLVGLPFTAFLVGSNALWAILIGTAVTKLLARGAMLPRVRGFVGDLVSFFRLNRASIMRSGTNALSGLFISTFPYYVVPLMFGLGSAPIILEVTFRIFRGTSVIYSAATDLAVPGQTRALATHDARRMVRTTLLAVGMCCLPAACACALLIFAGGPFFVFLLHSAATVPPAITPILVILILSNIVQMVSESLLQYTGFFPYLARVGAAVAAMMVAMTALAAFAKVDLVGFIAAYAAVFAIGALLMALAALRGPIRAAAASSGGAYSSTGWRKAIQNS